MARRRARRERLVAAVRLVAMVRLVALALWLPPREDVAKVLELMESALSQVGYLKAQVESLKETPHNHHNMLALR